MAYSAPLYMEVRWRLHGSDEAWSEPRRVNPVREVVVEELDRTKQYDFEARNVSACGAKSDWVPSTHTVPDVPPGNLTLADIKTEADNAAADALAANQELANIASDNVLSQGEKPVVIRDTNVITTEQAGIDAQATAFGVTTEKTAYDNAVTALTTYLATLTTPVLWSNLSGDTTIVGTTFRSKFADVYTTRQALLNAIYAAAKARADAAQDAADQAGVSTSVRNANFTGSTAGWSFTASPGPVAGGEFYQEATTNSPYPPIATYLVHAGQAGQSSAYADNLAYLPVAPGQVVTGVVCLQAFSANAGAYAAAVLKWYDASGTFLSITSGQPTCGPGGSYLQCNSKAQAPAPNNAAFVRLSILYINHTSGFINATACRVSGQLTNLDDLPDSATYIKGTATVGTSLVIPNSNFQMLADSSGKIPGWTLALGNYYLQSVGPSPWYGKRYLVMQGVSGGTGQANGTLKYKINPGDDVYVAGVVHAATGQYTAIGAFFYDGNDNFISPLDAATTVAAWTSVSNRTKAPANAAYIRLTVRVGNSGGTSYGLFNEVELRVNDVRVAGSGARLGDLRNQVMAGVGNYASGWSGGSISYTATSTSATISAGAATLVIGSQSLAYSASSTTVSGSAGVTRTYYLYYDDDSYTGGSKTLHATTSQITALSADGRVFVGQVTVTFPTSGSGSGGGGTGCPDENAWVLRADPDGIRPDWCVRAKDVKVGNYLRLTDGRAGEVTYSQRKPALRVKVFDENGATLICSRSAPLELAGSAGECVLAPDATGCQIKAREGCVKFDPIVWKVEDAGPGHVQHITCQNACFWTGDDPGYLFGHHNLKPIN